MQVSLLANTRTLDKNQLHLVRPPQYLKRQSLINAISEVFNDKTRWIWLENCPCYNLKAMQPLTHMKSLESSTTKPGKFGQRIASPPITWKPDTNKHKISGICNDETRSIWSVTPTHIHTPHSLKASLQQTRKLWHLQWQHLTLEQTCSQQWLEEPPTGRKQVTTPPQPCCSLRLFHKIAQTAQWSNGQGFRGTHDGG